MTPSDIKDIIALLLLGGILLYREWQHARQVHELTDKLLARTLGELTGHQLVTEKAKPKPIKVSASLPVVMDEQGFMPEVSIVDAQAASTSLMGS
jgi:hypothetical protein